MNIVGQDKILNIINSFDKNNFPHTIMIEGDKGSGKHLIANYIAEFLGKELVDISSNINLDTLFDINISSTPAVYVINFDYIRYNERNYFIKKQNAILKFIEEPNDLSTIIILVSNRSLLLPTVVNRCFSLKLLPYSKTILKTFINLENDLIYDYLTTPGQLIQYSNDIDNIISLADLVIQKINVAAIANTLTITKKLDLKPIDTYICDDNPLNIPLGIYYNDGEKSIEGLLCADNSTMDKIYLVKNGNNYDQFKTVLKNKKYCWEVDTTNKIDINLFLHILQKMLVDYYQKTSYNKYIKAYSLVSNAYNRINSTLCDRTRYMNNFLLDFKSVMKES